MRPACFLRIPWSTFYLYTEHLSSILEGNSWHFHSLPAVRGGSYGASDCHLRTPGSQPDGALPRDRGAPGDLSRLARMTTPMPQACPPMWNVNFTTICGVASSPMAFSGWAVTPASTSCCCPSVANGAAFAPRVPGDAWPRWRPTSSSRSSPGCRRANGSSRCRSPCATGWRPRRTSRPRSIPSFAPRSGSITSTRRSHEVTSGPRPPGLGHLYPTLWQCPQFESAFPLRLHGGRLSRSHRPGPASPALLTGEPPTDADIAAVLQKISRRVIRMLRRLGYLETGMEAPVATGYDPLRDTAPELARTMAASVQQRIACGERAGQHVRRIGAGFGPEGEAPRLTGPRCASVHGFSLHANTQIPAHRRDQLERLIRYTARGAVSLERLTQDANGDLVYTFTHPWSDGTTGIRLSPLELLEKLAALGPPAARASGALWGVPGAAQPPAWGDHPDATSARPRRPEAAPRRLRWSWARLLQRVFALDMGTLPVLSARDAAAHRRHHAGRGHPQNPPPSETRCRPTPHRACPFPPSTM